MLSDKIVLVTGVGGGIGDAIIRHLTPLSNQLISSSRSNLSSIYDNQIIPSNHSHISMDLTKEDNVIKLIERIKQEFGRLDIFINTVGGSLYAHPIEDFPLDEFLEVLSLNLTSAFLLTKHTIRLMKENNPNGGNIIHFVSSSARKISTNKAPYGISKAGLAKLVNYAASEAGKYDIRVNGINPGYVFTSRHVEDIHIQMKKSGKTEEEVTQSKMKLQQINRKIYPQDLLPLVELLSTTKVITGQIYDCTVGEVLD
jgi:NAD(P)-dependent dehydrogenase (short-subunit alcohol dehydrogenase family)